MRLRPALVVAAVALAPLAAASCSSDDDGSSPGPAAAEGGGATPGPDASRPETVPPEASTPADAAEGGPPTCTGPTCPEEPAFRPDVDEMLHDANAWLDGYAGSVEDMASSTTADHWGLATAIHNCSGELITGRGGTGKALRANLVPGPEVAVDWQTLPANGLIGGYTPASATIVTSYWFRISPGFRPSAIGAKFYEYWVPGGGARSQISPSMNGFPQHRFHLNPNSTGAFGAQPRGPFWDDLNDGAWHRWTHLRRPNLPNDRSRGIERVWIDGVKILDISGEAIGVTPDGGDRAFSTQTDVEAISTDGISYFWVPAYFNNPLPAAGSVDIDDFYVWKHAEP